MTASADFQETTQTPASAQKPSHLGLTAAWLALVFLGALLLKTKTAAFLIQFGTADGLVYPQVAYNIASGHGSTYNGINPTNGYHPLWMWLHIPLMAFASSLSSRMFLVQALWVVTGLCAALVWSAVIRRWTQSDSTAAIAAVVVGAFGWSLYVLYSGVETPLVFIMVAITAWLAERIRNASSRVDLNRLTIQFAAAIGLTFLSRLDSVFVILPLVIVALPGLRKNAGTINVLAALFTVLISAPYLSWNILNFKSPMPVSGFVKTVQGFSIGRSIQLLSERAGEIAAIGVSPKVLVAATLIFIVFLPLTLIGLKKHCPSLFRITTAIAVGAAMQYGYYLVRMREINIPWHLWPQFLTAYLLIFGLHYNILCEMKARISPSSASSASLAKLFLSFAFLAILGFVTLKYVRAKQPGRIQPAIQLQTGQWIAANLPAGSRIAMYDSFITANAAELDHFVDLNGLVENREGAELAKDKRYTQLVTERDCRYVVERVGNPDFPNYGQEVWRSPITSGTHPYGFIVERLQLQP